MGTRTKNGSGLSPSVMSSSTAALDQQSLDIESLRLTPNTAEESVHEEAPKMILAREKVLEEARKAMEEDSRKAVSIVVIGQ